MQAENAGVIAEYRKVVEDLYVCSTIYLLERLEKVIAFFFTIELREKGVGTATVSLVIMLLGKQNGLVANSHYPTPPPTWNGIAHHFFHFAHESLWLYGI